MKEKRRVLKSLKDKAWTKFNVSVAELGGQDKWQVATLGVVMIGNDGRLIDSCLQKILHFVELLHACDICDHKIEYY